MDSKDEEIKPGTPLPFFTQNEGLALALQTVGETLLDVVNLYTEEMLRKMGFATAREAWKAQKRGSVTFYFEKSRRIDSLLKAWNEAEKPALAGEPLNLEQCTPEEFMQAARYLQAKRVGWSDVWRRKSPKVFEGGGAPIKTAEGDGYRIDFPAFSIRSIDRKSEP